jgi:hypothetical protein
MSEVATLLDAARSLERAIQEVSPAFTVKTTSSINVLYIVMMSLVEPPADADDAADARPLLAIVMEWLEQRVLFVRYRVVFGHLFSDLMEMGYDGTALACLVNIHHRESAVSRSLERAVLDFGLAMSPIGRGCWGQARQTVPLPPRAFAVEGSEDAFWSFEDVRTACQMQAARPFIAAALGDLAADRVLAFAAPALPLTARLVEEEERMRREKIPTKRPVAGQEGDVRPPTETAPPPPSCATLDADLGQRGAERLRQDSAAYADRWIRNGLTLWRSQSEISSPAADLPGIVPTNPVSPLG